jgi:hypothetical protein
MALSNGLPVPAFPGFSHYGVVADQVKEIATTFNAESVEALSSVPEKYVAWADVGSRTTPGMFEVKIPIRLPSSMSFQPFDGSRSYNKLDIAAPAVRVNPFDLNYEWPMVIANGNPQLAEFYGASGLAQTIVGAARAYKAQLVASLLYKGMTNTALSLAAEVLTIPQPGFPNGLPLFTDGTDSASHYAHPFNSTSARFNNLFHGVGKFTDDGVFGDVMVNMTQVPHPSLPNMPLGCEVTDIIGPTHMLIPFWQTAVQTLSLQTTTAAGSEGVGAATTNIYNPEAIQRLGAAGFVGASGMSPWRFWIAPQLDSHPHLVANPGDHMWLAVSRPEGSGNRDTWAELAAPNKDFVPNVTLFGDADPESRRLRQVRMISDLDAGAAAGLPHFAALYMETTPT